MDGGSCIGRSVDSGSLAVITCPVCAVGTFLVCLVVAAAGITWGTSTNSAFTDTALTLVSLVSIVASAFSRSLGAEDPLGIVFVAFYAGSTGAGEVSNRLALRTLSVSVRGTDFPVADGALFVEVVVGVALVAAEVVC